jgi:glutamate synthase (ferredoxin)
MEIKEGLYSNQYEHDSCGIGFIAHLKGEKSHQIVTDALTALANMEHRGACGCEANTGDGAGVLIQIPDALLREETSKLGFDLPQEGKYGVGLVFLPNDEKEQAHAKQLLEEVVSDKGQKLLGWREVPYDDSMIGDTAKSVMPSFFHCFIGLGENGAGLPGTEYEAFERRLYIIRKLWEKKIKEAKLKEEKLAYIASLSSRKLVYKGMLISTQVRDFFNDLKNEKLVSAIAMVHSRFSTNTFPSWDLAQPFRFLSHNGEINTLRGNANWMKARSALLKSNLFGDELDEIFPVINEGNSDSASFDNVLELLVMGGYSLPHAVMMMIPEAWEGHDSMSKIKKDFYAYHACLMEPWDGPASIGFTDGVVIGAVLDRNGLRPSRYYVTKDERVIMASEVGVIKVEPENILKTGRLQPGRMFLVDMSEGRIIVDKELKEKIATEKPYSEWLEENLAELCDLPEPAHLIENDPDTLTNRQIMFGYTQEDLSILLHPMAEKGLEGIGSMGNDAQLAVLAEKPQILYNYFKQLFAQVTNPPLDAIREELVTSVYTTVGSEKNLLDPVAESCHHIRLTNPALSNEQLAQLKALGDNPYKNLQSEVLPMIFPASKGVEGMRQALDELFKRADQAIENGANILIISDRGVNEKYAPIPSLLATAGLHHHLVRGGNRAKAAIIVESGEAREVHHFCTLVGYGAAAVNPYLVFESFGQMIHQGLLKDVDQEQSVLNYSKAVKKGIVKVMSKMGISTIQSYRGAQIFEAIGLNQEVIDQYFTKTASRIQGIGLKEICEETLKRHSQAYPKRVAGRKLLDIGGEYQWRRGGVEHLLSPTVVSKLQHSTEFNDYKLYKDYAKLVNDQSQRLCTLRGLMKFKDRKSIPLDEVEPIENIMRRFKTGAMSYGSISAESHEALAIAMNRIGGKSNTGEGGEDPKRFTPDENGDLRRSSIKQVASGRFGVTSHYLANSDEIQIKMAQGAKPGEGGQLPGPKVYPWIAKVRHSTPGVGLISPPPHHDIYSIEDLAQLIFDLKNSNPSASVNVKLVSEVGVGTIAAGVSKAHADVVLISGYDGGTGASPLTSLKHAGLPWELGLAETQQTLVRNNLRDRIIVEVDGQLKTGRDVVIGALLGAEEYGFSTAPLVTLGCIMMRVCHLNTCPVGIATQNPELRKKFTGNPDRVVSYFKFVAEEIREIMAELGFKTMDEMIGHAEILDFNSAIAHWKSKGLDFSTIFHQPEVGDNVAKKCITAQDHGLDKVIDNELIRLAKPALENREPVNIELDICNLNRTTGTMLGSAISKKYGEDGLADGTINIKFKGSAGQSFGAFVPSGVTMTVEGDANDYVGKGLSGGRIIVYPHKESTYTPEDNIIIGNVVLYGATKGEAFFRGVAGERFCVRNSGAKTVVEGVGDHGCEYMTGGRVVILGPTGRNFGAGMSGGVAYIYDPKKLFEPNCNKEMVEVEDDFDDEDISIIKDLISKHVKYTGSTPGKKIIDNFDAEIKNFVKVMPRDYKKALIEIRKKMAEKGITEYEAMYGT